MQTGGTGWAALALNSDFLALANLDPTYRGLGGFLRSELVRASVATERERKSPILYTTTQQG